MMKSSTLHIKPTSASYPYYANHTTYHEGDAGMDLFVLEDTTIAPYKTAFIDYQICCQMVEKTTEAVTVDIIDEHFRSPFGYQQKCSTRDACYYLYARSSLSKTPLMLANGVGVFDASYRGNVISALTNCSDTPYTIKAGQRLVQICSRNLDPFEIKIVDNLNSTTRNTGGFGSTGL